ncbi:unnamed protein product [Musa acuminata subsp. malaccensis]|uniref:(wild Malaysian banana) hypothetical protein n=1 Tax=Musa acuminata subsp. malaccensis TaxID=214687 RepID=A0A804K0E9_MUSAM|nr:unnamed protein product [Musa acuminata subsp. malaccensis]
MIYLSLNGTCLLNNSTVYLGSSTCSSSASLAGAICSVHETATVFLCQTTQVILTGRLLVHYSLCIVALTEISALLPCLEPMFNIFPFLEELELFSNVVDRWVVNAIDKIPGYMKLCFPVVFDIGKRCRI